MILGFAGRGINRCSSSGARKIRPRLLFSPILFTFRDSCSVNLFRLRFLSAINLDGFLVAFLDRLLECAMTSFVLIRAIFRLGFLCTRLSHFKSEMKFGQTFTEYLHGEQEAFLNKCSHVEYKRLKKFLKSCRVCRALSESDDGGNDRREEGKEMSEFCRCNSCACMLRFPT